MRRFTLVSAAPEGFDALPPSMAFILAPEAPWGPSCSCEDCRLGAQGSVPPGAWRALPLGKALGPSNLMNAQPAKSISSNPLQQSSQGNLTKGSTARTHAVQTRPRASQAGGGQAGSLACNQHSAEIEDVLVGRVSSLALRHARRPSSHTGTGLTPSSREPHGSKMDIETQQLCRFCNPLIRFFRDPRAAHPLSR